MDEQLQIAAENGDVDALYTRLAQDPYLLDRIDRIPIVDTPLHVAARAGKPHFAMEVANLKPSLAWKLNHVGLSPFHLALQNKCTYMVRGLIATDSQLIRVKAKGMITPLHYLAQTDDADLLAEILSACPSSVEDTTIHCETAVHIAVKNCSIGAFKVLLGWLRRIDKEDILNWKDEDGNTALHIATSTNLTEVLKLLVKNVNVNVKNFNGLTAMDIFHLQGTLQNIEIGKTLRRAKAKKASDLPPDVTLGDYLSRELTLIEKRDKYFGINSQKSPSDVRSVVLVVAILIATATYQAGLSPPGGYWQDDYNPSANNGSNNSNTSLGQGQRQHRAGQIIMGPQYLFYFFTLNSCAFYLSVWTILVVIIGLPYSVTLSTSTSLLLCAYYSSLDSTFPTRQNSTAFIVARALYISFIYLSAVLVYSIPLAAYRKYEKLKRRVDTIRGSKILTGPGT
ncbi:ankyrin repeat-containing protein BDA1-like [Herrania umbratica]|uniref:Ankyrin repeat-containing protein BDA1-like n=1 Tax=Herrania umbratica TaxID=108875 RepID=A0A6J1B1F2_9ROSI|nr:ankyrin repeat-containing protein BDA1-like [Herrania umbratica]